MQTPSELDEALAEELGRFDSWFVQRQKENGIFDATSLTSFERGAVKAYIVYASTDRPADPE